MDRMNTSHGTRLDRLEAITGPPDLEALDDNARRWFLGLCDASILATIGRFARYLAERRYHHALGTRRPWADDWRQATTDAERDALVEAELERSLAMGPDDPEMLGVWLETADREGWPPLVGLTFAMNRAGFEVVLARSRKDLDVSRACDMPGSVAWRRAHPAWRPGMGTEDATAFELALADEAHRRGAEWFG